MRHEFMYRMDPAIPKELEAMIPLLIFCLIFLLIIMLLCIISYVLRGLAIYKMSKARGLQNGWLGFIPCANNYQLGMIAGEIELGNKRIKNPGLWLLLLPIIYGIVFTIGYFAMMIPYFISIFSLGSNPMPEEVIGPVTALMFALMIFVLIMLFAQVILYLFRYLALHRIFSHYSTGQKPVFYMIIAMFVPLAESILLFMHSKRPLLTIQEQPQILPETVI